MRKNGGGELSKWWCVSFGFPSRLARAMPIHVCTEPEPVKYLHGEIS